MVNSGNQSMGEAMTSQDESQLELLPLSIRERIEAAAKRFLEREDEKAQRKAKHKAQAMAAGGGPGNTARGSTPCHNKEVTR